MQKITPFLWFDGNAEEAMNLYVSIFRIRGCGVPDMAMRARGRKNGHVREFQLEGQQFYELNGGPQYKSARDILLVTAETGKVDDLWTSFGRRTQGQMWLMQDKYGRPEIIPSGWENAAGKNPRKR